jgi:hypothetical protein
VTLGIPLSLIHSAFLPSVKLSLPIIPGIDLVPGRQKALLRSACFGAAFCGDGAPSLPLPPGSDPSYARSDRPPAPSPVFYSTCLRLRVLNALREPRPGIPLTMGQLEALTLEGVVARLVSGTW